MRVPLAFQGSTQTAHFLTQHFPVHTSKTSEKEPGALKLTEGDNALTLSSPFGTEDFLKPLSLQDLHQHYNRVCVRLAHTRKIGPWLFDEEQQTLLGDCPVNLSEKETLIVKALAQEPEGLSKAALLTRIWGHDDTIETRTVESHIYGLRQKLESDPQNPCLLISTPQGYKIPVESVCKIL